MTEKLLTIREAASRLGVPVSWLRREARDGRLPGLLIGRRYYLDIMAVRDALAERAKGERGVTRG